MAGPLKGIKVVDLSRILAGPWATQVLADFGAHVIKVERPRVGDDTRHWGPPYLNDENQSKDQDAAYFLAANRGKQSITIDFTQAEGQEIIRALVKDADLLVENYKVGGLKKYGLDYESLKKVNPRLIYCAITGFGQTGPNKNKAGYDAVIQGMGGLMSITGESDDQPGGGPQKVGVAVADLMTGMYAVSAICAALFQRERTGIGEYIDLALFDTQVGWLANQNMNFLVGGETPTRQGTAHPNIAPYQALKAKDGYFMLAVGNDRQFERFCQIVGLAHIVSLEQYATNKARVNNRQSLIKLIEERLQTQTAASWIEALERVQVPCSPINTIAQVFDEPQVKARDLLFNLPHAKGKSVPQVANPVKFSQNPIEYQTAPPTLGQDTDGILQSLGFDKNAIADLKNKGVC